MQIKLIEIQNFRKLKSVRVELAEKTTLFVGANNSGKTSAMLALRYFMVETGSFCINDFTISKWPFIDKIGGEWETPPAQSPKPLTLLEWSEILPALDVWLKVEKNEVQHVCDILPSLSWSNKDLIGIRLRLEPKNIEDLYKEYIAVRKTASETLCEVRKGKKKCNVNRTSAVRKLTLFIFRHLQHLRGQILHYIWHDFGPIRNFYSQHVQQDLNMFIRFSYQT